METPVTIKTHKRFNEIITYWNDTFSYPTNPRDDGNIYYRRIHIANWDQKLHYEFYCYSQTNEIGIELHSEPRNNSPFNWNKVKTAVQSFRGIKINNKEIKSSLNDSAKRSWLKIKLPLSNDIKDICEHMAELINITKQSITEALMI